MPTRTEAVQALYDAADDLYAEVGKLPMGSVNHGAYEALGRALHAYSTSTPDPLPAEVQRVLDAAGHVIHTTRVNHPDAADAWGDLESAVDAYRSTQPEPLSARLARLRPGSVVQDEDNDTCTVIGNHPASQTLFVEWTESTGKKWADAFGYGRFTAILSESP